jgi:3-keto-5-aminohexanoate cleavage enzyme
MFPLCTLGVSMGCDLVRVGLEDSIHLPNGKVARNNQEMVQEMVKIAALFGRTPATVDDARARFFTV